MTIIDGVEPTPGPASLPLPDPPTVSKVIAAGDYVQATRREETIGKKPDNFSVETFTVKRVLVSGAVTGCSRGTIDPAEGWTLDLLQKGAANLPLPETAAEIVAVTTTGQVLHLIGKRGRWLDVDSGLKVNDDLILGIRDYDEWQVEADAYAAAVAALPVEPDEPLPGAEGPAEGASLPVEGVPVVDHPATEEGTTS